MLKNLDLNPVYKSTELKVISSFYIPCLLESKIYLRVAAYFDSKALSYYSKGIEGLIKQRGKYQLIISESLSESDYNAIKNGYDLKDKLCDGLLANFSDDELNNIDILRIKNLSYLISIGLIDVKVAFTRRGIFHDKFGLFEDRAGNIVYFRGSNNETGAAIENNYESFEVTTNWDCGFNEALKIDLAIKTFNNLWMNTENGVCVVDFTDVILKKIAKYNDGRVFMEKEALFTNRIEVDYQNEQIICSNYSDKIFQSTDFYIMKNFKRYLNELSESRLVFKKMTNYIDIKKFISKIEDFCTKRDVECCVSDELTEFLKSKDLQIEKRAKLGIDIKNQEDIVLSQFKTFERIVNREMERQLRPLQMWGAFHICMMNKSANFSVPGTGKTSIVYGAYSFLSNPDKNSIDKVVVIGPKSSFLAWKDEFISNFGSKRVLSYFDIHENATSKKERVFHLRYQSGDNNLILVNYESMNSLEDVLCEIIDERTLLVFDEVHKVKAIYGERATAALRISQKAKYKVVLSGTPIPNSYMDIYNMLNILYHDEYNDHFGYDIRDLTNPGEELIQSINNKIFPFYCRVTKNDLMIPLPEPDIIIKSDMTACELELFKLIYTKLSKNILELYIRLIQASTNPELLYDAIDYHEIGELFPEFSGKEESKKSVEPLGMFDDMRSLIKKVGNTSKFEAGIQLIDQLVSEGKPVIVWSLFIKTIFKIKNLLEFKGIRVKVIYGAIPLDERESIIKEFKDGKIDVIVTNPNTMAESVSLHMICHDAVYFEYNFNLTYMLQSRDRINRLGLKDEQYTRYYYLMLESNHIKYNSIDEKIYNRLKEKEQIMLEAIEGQTLRRVEFDDMEDILGILNSEINV